MAKGLRLVSLDIHLKASYTGKDQSWSLSLGGYCGLGSHLRSHESPSIMSSKSTTLLNKGHFSYLVNLIKLVISLFNLVRKCGRNGRIQEKLFHVEVLKSKYFHIKRLVSSFEVFFLKPHALNLNVLHI